MTIDDLINNANLHTAWHGYMSACLPTYQNGIKIVLRASSSPDLLVRIYRFFKKESSLPDHGMLKSSFLTHVIS